MFSSFSHANQVTTESLREKFFLTDSNKEGMQSLGYKVSDYVVDYLSGAEGRKVYAGKTYRELKDIFAEYEIPFDSQDLSLVFKQFDTIVDNSMHFNSKYIGHMLTVPTYISVLVNSVIDSMNFDMSDDTAPDFIREIEDQTVNWLTELVGYQTVTTELKEQIVPGGVITNGGTIANLMAFLVFRNKFLTDVGIDVHTEGVMSLPSDEKVVVFVSEEAHYSLEKLCGYVGLGSENVLSVLVDKDFRMDVQDLKRKVYQAKKDGKVILAIVATAGTTEFGSIDPLEEIAEVARKNNIWFHVDAAYGGACALTQRHKNLKKSMHAMRLADSITIDPHKLLYMPYNMGSFLVKDRQNLRYIKGMREVKLFGKTIQETKRFDAFKLWTTLQFMGIDNMAKLIDYTIDMTFYLHGLFKNAEDFELFNDPEMNMFVLRYVPRYLKVKLDRARLGNDAEKIQAINAQLDMLNVSIQETLQAEGESWVSYTTVNNVTAFRFVLMNPFLSPKTLDESFLTIRRTAERVAKVKNKISKFPKRPVVSKDIFSGVDSFRKYFASSENKEEVRKIGREIIDVILRKEKHQNIDLDFQKSLPKEAASVEHILSVLQTVYEKSYAYTTHKNPLVPFISILSGTVFTALNPNQIAFEVSPVATAAEDKLVRELANIIGYKLFFVKEGDLNIVVRPGGIVTNSASFSLLTMLLVARNKILKQKGQNKKDVAEVGLQMVAQEDLVFITSKSQESITKDLASVLGLGSERLIVVDEINGNTNIDSLVEQVRFAKASNKTIIATDVFISNADELNSAKLNQLRSIDELFINFTFAGDSINILNKNGILCEKIINASDSVVLHLQDWFNIQNGIGIVLFRDRDILESYLKQSAPYVMRKMEESVMRNIGSYSIEGSKGFQALPLMTALQHIGIDAYTQM